MFTRKSNAVPIKAERVRLIRCGFAVGGHTSWPGFTTAGVVHLHAFAGRGCRPAERFCTGFHFARNFSAPRRQIIINVEVDTRKFHPADFANEVRECTRPTSDASAKYHLQRLSLPLICTFVDEHRHCRFCFAFPDISLES